MRRSSESDALVCFGMTGDLAHKKIFPALYRMAKRGVLTNTVVAIKRSERPTKAGFHPLHLETLKGYAEDDSNPLDDLDAA